MEIAVEKILDHISFTTFSGEKNTAIRSIVALDHGPIDEFSIFWCSDKFREKLLNIETGTVILSESAYEWVSEEHQKMNGMNWIVVENPRAVFSEIISAFFYKGETFGEVAKSASIHASVKYNPDTVKIGENVVIEADVEIGDNVVIGHNSVVSSGSVLGNGVKIGCNSTIGGVGFGYEKEAGGNFKLIPHIGNVVLENNVEVGNNVAIDRGVLGSTLLMENVKVDNLVHISHGVRIGKNSLIIANSMIAGSCEIGENVWVSPSVSIIQKTKIGDNSLVGLGSVVLKPVEESSVVAGVPAKKIKGK